MPTTTYKKLTLPTQGVTTTWGDALNNYPFTEIDKMLGGISTLAITGSTYAMSAAESQSAIVRITGTLSASCLVTTLCEGISLVENVTTGSYAITFRIGTTTAVTIPQGHRCVVITDATNGARIWSSSIIEDLAASGVIKRTSVGDITTDSGTTAISFCKDNSGSALSTGVQGDISIPFDCTITGVKLLADQSGSIVVDLWKDVYANYPPTVADTICASAKPTLSSATKYNDTTLTGWTTSVSAGDVIRYNIDSVSTITRILISLTVTRY